MCWVSGSGSIGALVGVEAGGWSPHGQGPGPGIWYTASCNTDTAASTGPDDTVYHKLGFIHLAVSSFYLWYQVVNDMQNTSECMVLFSIFYAEMHALEMYFVHCQYNVLLWCGTAYWNMVWYRTWFCHCEILLDKNDSGNVDISCLCIQALTSVHPRLFWCSNEQKSSQCKGIYPFQK